MTSQSVPWRGVQGVGVVFHLGYDQKVPGTQSWRGMCGRNTLVWYAITTWQTYLERRFGRCSTKPCMIDTWQANLEGSAWHGALAHPSQYSIFIHSKNKSFTPPHTDRLAPLIGKLCWDSGASLYCQHHHVFLLGVLLSVVLVDQAIWFVRCRTSFGIVKLRE